VAIKREEDVLLMICSQTIQKPLTQET